MSKVSTVAVAQLVESRIVIPVVVGSSPIVHPTHALTKQPLRLFFSDAYVESKFPILGCAHLDL